MFLSKCFRVGMYVFLKSTSFYGLDPSCLIHLASNVKQALRDMLQEGLETGVVRPLDRTVLPASHAKQAVKYVLNALRLQVACLWYSSLTSLPSYLDGQCTGKLLLEAKATNVPIVVPDPQRFICDENSSYLVVGTVTMPPPWSINDLTQFSF